MRHLLANSAISSGPVTCPGGPRYQMTAPLTCGGGGTAAEGMEYSGCPGAAPLPLLVTPSRSADALLPHEASAGATAKPHAVLRAQWPMAVSILRVITRLYCAVAVQCSYS
ncbi:hypothetical protein CFAM422_010359 [Trichoderma lentiforme]|uniref:Uncharacterized protein n=1 Tax=Trichoderma lentiforme TaxID=1567552 RepID=A0A9P5C896_9HYPO|nr:hypothetical protein CFAM422_010359 [Trichoderma lentiforme]